MTVFWFCFAIATRKYETWSLYPCELWTVIGSDDDAGSISLCLSLSLLNLPTHIHSRMHCLGRDGGRREWAEETINLYYSWTNKARRPIEAKYNPYRISNWQRWWWWWCVDFPTKNKKIHRCYMYFSSVVTKSVLVTHWYTITIGYSFRNQEKVFVKYESC